MLNIVCIKLRENDFEFNTEQIVLTDRRLKILKDDNIPFYSVFILCQNSEKFKQFGYCLLIVVYFNPEANTVESAQDTTSIKQFCLKSPLFSSPRTHLPYSIKRPLFRLYS